MFELILWQQMIARVSYVGIRVIGKKSVYMHVCVYCLNKLLAETLV